MLRPGIDINVYICICYLVVKGPYINAETTAGGIAHWATSQVKGRLRTNATDYKAAWEGYLKAVIDISVHNQITHGGPIIGQFLLHYM